MVKILLLLPEISKIVKEDVKHGHSSKTPHKTTPSPPPKSSLSTQASPRWTWPCKCKIKIKTILAFGIYPISSRINNNLAKLMLKITEAATTATSKKDSWRKTSATSTRINRSQVIMRGTILRDHIFRRDFRWRGRVNSTSTTPNARHPATSTHKPSHLQQIRHQPLWQSQAVV